jgi:hypothetical protein
MRFFAARPSEDTQAEIRETHDYSKKPLTGQTLTRFSLSPGLGLQGLTLALNLWITTVRRALHSYNPAARRTRFPQ